MRFFKPAMLLGHAASISRRFEGLRHSYFDFIVREIKIKRGAEAAPDQVTLGGEADLALRGFQYWLYLPFSIAHPYLSDKHYQEFSGHLVMELSGKFKKEVEAFFIEFNEHRHNYVDLIAHVSMPVARTITPLLDPRTMEITANILPFFAMDSQIVIAEQFGDGKTASQLESRKRVKYDTMDSGATLTAPMFCFNCGCSFSLETRCCLLCGVPLLFVGPECDPQFAPQSGSAMPQFESQETELALAEAPRRVEAALTDIPAEMIEKGQYFRRNHFSGISNWEDRMFSEFGEKVVPLLREIWSRTS